MRTRSRPESSSPATLNSGALAWMTQVNESSRPMRNERRLSQFDLASPLLLGLGKFPREDGEKDDVVDAEDDPQHRERGEANPGPEGRLPSPWECRERVGGERLEVKAWR